MGHDVYITLNKKFGIWEHKFLLQRPEVIATVVTVLQMAWTVAGPRRLRAPALATEFWFCVKGCAKLPLPENSKEGTF